MQAATKNAYPKLDEVARAVLETPADRPAIEFNKQWIEWGALSALARQIDDLLVRCDIRPGGTVALVARNHPSAIISLVALLAARVNIRMIYPFQSATSIANELEALVPDAVIAARDDLGDEILNTLHSQRIAGIALSGFEAECVAGRGEREPCQRHTEDIDSDELGIDILTSGTTGKPKPFRISYKMIVRDMLANSAAGAGGQSDPQALEPVLLYFPVGNISGLYTTLPAILGGRRVVLLDRFNVHDWHDFVLRYRPVVGGMPPAAIQMVLDANIPKEDLASIKFFGAGAAPLDPAVQKAFEDRYGIPILLSYGATEFGGPVTRMTPDMHAKDGHKKIGTVGKAMPGVKLRVVSQDSGEPLPAGEVGILEVVSPRIGPQWIRTSDLAVLDEDGYLFHHGRADGAIIRGGFKILPDTVEKALLAHPAVSAAAVVGIRDQRLGQVPAAAVILKPGQQADETVLSDHLRERLLKTHIPTAWRFVEELPRTKLSFKVDQAAVRKLFE